VISWKPQKLFIVSLFSRLVINSPRAIRSRASEKLKESTKGETLNEWFEKKKTGKDCDAAMSPDGDLIPVGDDDHDFTPSMSAKEKGAESTSGDEWSPEAREKAAEARKYGSKKSQVTRKELAEHEKKLSSYTEKNGITRKKPGNVSKEEWSGYQEHKREGGEMSFQEWRGE